MYECSLVHVHVHIYVCLYAFANTCVHLCLCVSVVWTERLDLAFCGYFRQCRRPILTLLLGEVLDPISSTRCKKGEGRPNPNCHISLVIRE